MVYLKHVTCRENLNLLRRQPETLGSRKDEDTRQTSLWLGRGGTAIKTMC